VYLRDREDQRRIASLTFIEEVLAGGVVEFIDENGGGRACAFESPQ